MKKRKYSYPKEWFIMALKRYRRKQNKHQRTKIGPLSNLSYICLAMSAAREQGKQDVYDQAVVLYDNASGITFGFETFSCSVAKKHNKLKYPSSNWRL